MLDDKDIAGTITEIRGGIDAWFVAPLTCKRAAAAEKLTAIFKTLAITTVEFSADIRAAYAAAQQQTAPGDRIIIFGSFYTVAELMQPASQ